MIDSGKNICKIKELENKYDSIIELEQSIIKLMECTYTDSIVKKIVKAIESKNNHFIYRTPLSQVLGTKLYMLLFK